MRVMNDEELSNINGGGISFWTVMGIAGIITFIAGVLDGFTRPCKCN